MSKALAKKVAIALATVNPIAGQDYDQLCMDPQSISVRAENLLRDREYGNYVRPSRDSDDWGGEGARVIISMEPGGGKNDCVIPLDYYGNGMAHSCKASDILGDFHIEFINPGVAAVYPA
jgi:hypothetical protein